MQPRHDLPSVQEETPAQVYLPGGLKRNVVIVHVFLIQISTTKSKIKLTVDTMLRWKL